MDAVISVNDAQEIVLFNAAAEKMFRCSAADAMGTPISRFIPQRFRGGHEAHLQRFGETGATNRAIGHSSTLHALRADGTEFPMEASISQADTRLGKLFTIIVRDTTERQRAEQALRESEERLKSVLDNINDGLVAADVAGNFILWNPAAERILGRGQAAIPPLRWSEHYQIFQTDQVTPFPPEELPLAKAMKGKHAYAKMFIRHKGDGIGSWIEVAATPLRDHDGMLCGGVAAFRDITQRVIADREIRRLSADLERRVVERTAQLEAVNKELESFTYSVSHDLRAPLRQIAGFAEILSKDYGPTLAPDARGYVERIAGGAHNMSQLINEMLNLSRLERQSLQRQRINLNSLVEETISVLQPETEGRRVEWKIGELPELECDPVLTRQIFQNLISNALKYSRKREIATIEIGSVMRDGSPAIFVRDNGIGFDMRYADKLFGAFQRLHKREEFEGIGIGLATVARIVRKHSGKVWAEAEAERGATFYFTLAGTVTSERSALANGATVG